MPLRLSLPSLRFAVLLAGLHFVAVLAISLVLLIDLANFVIGPDSNLLALFTIAITVTVITLGVGYLRVRGQAVSDRRLAAWPALLTLVCWLFDVGWLYLLKLNNIYYGPLYLLLLASFMGRTLLAAMLLLFLPGGRKLRWGLLALALLQVALCSLLVYGTAIEPFNLQTSHVSVTSDKLPAGYKLRIVQLSDIHVERITERERAMVTAVNQARPDLLLTTGDYLNISNLNDAVSYAQVRELFGQMHATYGTYAIAGTVEWYIPLQTIFTGTDTVLLYNRGVRQTIRGQTIDIGGMPSNNYLMSAVRRSLVNQGASQADYRILLTHKPEHMEDAKQSGFDLYLCGHTHGGQVALPVYGAITTLSKYGKKYEQGLYHEENTYMYVNRGVGMEGNGAPRIRFLAPPEVTVIDVVGTGK